MTINLIPPKLKKEKQYRKIIGIGFSFAMVVFLFLFITTGTLMAANYYYQSDLSKLKKQVDDQSQTIKKYTNLEKEVTSTNKKLEIINQIDSGRIIWSNIISEMAASTPTAVQIKQFSSGAEGRITIIGVAETRRDIAKFKDKLESSKNFQNVVFDSSSLDQSLNNFSFNITCELEEIK